MPHSTANYGRRRALAIVALAAAAALVVVAVTRLTGSGAAESSKPGDAGLRAQATPTPKPPKELPRGGRKIFPDFRVVAYYGAPQADALGALGIGTPTQMTRKLKKQAKPYARKTRPVLPAMELIAVVAAAAPGPGNRYNFRQPDA